MRVATPLLNMAYEQGGPPDAPPVLLLHGWPDDPRTFDRIAPALWPHFRTLTPWLRGFGPTSFRLAATPRSGQIAAMAQDVLDFADALHLRQFAVVGHDWGARIAYLLASIFPERISRIAALSVGWQLGRYATPSLEQARSFWYQWFLATDRGAEFVHGNGKAFAEFQWRTWSPPGWYTREEFELTALSFENPDWAEVTIHSYRVRWGEAEPDPRYAELERAAEKARIVGVPCLMIQGGDDRCVLPAASAGKEGHFSKSYRRVVLDGVGHFPTREAPAEVARLILDFLQG